MAEDQSGYYIYTASEAAAVLFSKRSAQTHAPYLLPHVGPDSAVLDVGCGGGQITVGLANAASVGHVLGVDLDEAPLERARSLAASSNVDNVEFRAASAYDLPTEDASFDVVHFHGVLAHLAEPERAIAEAMRVLRPGGIFGAQEPEKDADICGGPFADAARRFDNLLMDDWRRGGGNPCLGRDLKGMVANAGFQDIENGAVFDWADGDSNRAIDVFCLSILREPGFRDRVLQAGLIDLAGLQELVDSYEMRTKEPSSFFAGAEVWVLGRRS